MRTRKHAQRLADVFVWAVLIVMILPALWLVFTSVRNPVEVNAKPPVWIPRELTLDGFKPLFGQATEMTGAIPFDRYFINSVVVSVVSTILAVALGTMAGYVFSRFRFRGKQVLFLGVMLSRAIPGIALGLPLFILFARLSQGNPIKLIDSPLGLIIVYVAVNVPFTIWLMDGFFREIPAELSEARRLTAARNGRPLRASIFPWLCPAWPPARSSPSSPRGMNFNSPRCSRERSTPRRRRSACLTSPASSPLTGAAWRPCQP